MDLPWGNDKTTKFATTVGLVTSDGPNGPNIMAAEWTHQVSYSPGLIAVCIGHGKATNENIRASKEFGVSLAAEDQNVISSFSGSSHGNAVNKIAALKELGFKFYKAKKINTLMVEGAALYVECKVVNVIDLGDHTMFVGEVQEASLGSKAPLLYHKLKYWKIGENIPKPDVMAIPKVKAAAEKFGKSG